MRAGLVQYAPHWHDPEANERSLTSLLRGASGDIGLLVIPEMTLTGFTMEGERFADDRVSGDGRLFAGLAREYGTHLL